MRAFVIVVRARRGHVRARVYIMVQKVAINCVISSIHSTGLRFAGRRYAPPLMAIPDITDRRNVTDTTPEENRHMETRAPHSLYRKMDLLARRSIRFIFAFPWISELILSALSAMQNSWCFKAYLAIRIMFYALYFFLRKHI